MKTLIIILIGILISNLKSFSQSPVLIQVYPHIGNNAMTLVWTAPVGVIIDDYEIQRSENNGAFLSLPAVGVITSYTNINLNVASNYTYRVRAKIGGVWKRPSNEVSNSFKRIWPVLKASDGITEDIELLHGFGQAIQAGGFNYLHEGLDIHGQSEDKNELVVAPIGGILRHASHLAGTDYYYWHVDLEVSIDGTTHFIQFLHLKDNIPYKLKMAFMNGIEISVAAGEVLGYILDPTAAWPTLSTHTHCHHWDRVNPAFPYDNVSRNILPGALNPFKIWDKNIYRDPQEIVPEVMNTNDDNLDGTVDNDDKPLGFIRSPIPAMNPNFTGIIDNKAIVHNGVDIVVEAADKQSSDAPWQNPKVVGYYIQQWENNIWKDAVKTPATPYVLIDHKDYYSKTHHADPPLDNVKLNAIIGFDVNLPSKKPDAEHTPADYTWDQWFTYIVTNTSGDLGNGNTNDIQDEQRWATDAQNSVTEANGYKTGYTKARVIDEAKFPDGKYRVHIRLEDYINKPPDYKKEILVDNFRPYAKKVKIQGGKLNYTGEWTWEASGTGKLKFTPQPNDAPTEKACCEITVTITTSEPMKDVNIAVSTLSFSKNSITPVANTDSKEWVFVIPADKTKNATEGPHIIEIDGHDIAGTSLQGFISTDDVPGSEIHKRELNDNWIPNIPPVKDKVHKFKILNLTDSIQITPKTKAKPCNGEATITITNPPAGSFEYSLDGGGYQSGNKFTGLKADRYLATIRQTGTLCSFSKEFVIEQDLPDPNTGTETPTVTISTNAPFCNNTIPNCGSFAVVNFTSSICYATYSWTSTKDVGFGTSGTGKILPFTPVNTTNAPIQAVVTVKATANHRTSEPKNITVTVNPAPTVNANPASQLKCSEEPIDPITIDNPNQISGTTFKWERDNATNLTGISASGTGSTISGTLTNTTKELQITTFIITAIANGCSSAPVTVTIKVKPKPTINAASNQTACSNEAISPIRITNPNEVDGTVFSWTRDNSGVLPGIAASGNGSSTITGTMINNSGAAQSTKFTINAIADGCESSPAEITVTVNPVPVVKISVGTPAIQTICSGQAITPINIDPIILAGTQVTWTRDNNIHLTGIASSGSGYSITGMLTNNTDRKQTTTLVIKASANNCYTLTSVTITVKPTPKASALPASTQVITSGSQISPIFLIDENDIEATVFSWTRDNTTNVTGMPANGTGNNITGTLFNFTTIVETTTFTITATADGCTSTPVTVKIDVIPPTTITAILRNLILRIFSPAPSPGNFTSGAANNGAPITLVPPFDPNITNYTALVANSVRSLTVTPTLEDPLATVTVNGNLVTSGNESGEIQLCVGSNIIRIIVIAQDGTTKTYTVIVTREGPGQNFYVDDGSNTGDRFTMGSAAGNDITGIGSTAKPFRTINKAISMASCGDNIYVDAGSYSEFINVNKSLKIYGPNYDQSPLSNPSTRTTEAVITAPASGVIFQASTNATNIEIKGFKLLSGAPLTDGHLQRSPDQDIDIVFEKNWINRGNNLFAGTLTRWRSVTIKDNHFTNTDFTATSSAIQLNDANDPLPAPQRLATVTAVITDNKIETTNFGAILLDNIASATVQRNIIKAVPHEAIQLAGGIGNATISENDIRNSNLSNVADGGGIRIFGSQFTGIINIRNNFVTNNTFNGVAVKNGETITNPNIHINNNSFTGLAPGSYGIYHGGTNPGGTGGSTSPAAGKLDGECNWFGSPNAAIVATKVFGPVDYTPWLNNGTDGSANPGFQPSGICSGGAPIASKVETPGEEIIAAPVTKLKEGTPEVFSVSVFPNPTSKDFTIRIETTGKEPVTIKISDAVGRIISVYSNVTGKTLKFGSNFRTGLYYAETIQGSKHTVTKLIKIE